MTTIEARERWTDALRRLKELFGTYPKIAMAVGSHENTVQNWVTKGMLPDRLRERRIAQVLKIKPDELRMALDTLRDEQFMIRLRRHPLAPEVEPARHPFRRPRLVGGAGAAETPSRRPSRRTEAQAARPRRGSNRVKPHPLRDFLYGRRLIGQVWFEDVVEDVA